MKILFISWWFPYPPDNGSKIRIYNLLKELRKRHDITLLSFAEPGEASPADQEALLTICKRVRVTPRIRFNPSRVRALVGFMSSMPRSLVDTYSAQMSGLVRDEVARDGYDLILASELGAMRYALETNGVPRLLEELQLAVLREAFTSQVTFARRLRYGLSWWKTARYLRQALGRFDACTVASAQEQQLLAQTVPQPPPVGVIPNGVDLDHYAGDFGPLEPGALVYNGALTYGANFDAMTFFLADIWPLIRARCPSARLYITGRNDGVPLADLPRAEGVVFTGYLDDVRPRIARSQVTVVPLRVGGGTRLKVLESLALGTPVVTTSKGAEGLDLVPGRDLLLADEPTEFAAAVLRLLHDANLRETLGRYGRKAVQTKYNWQIIGQQLDDFIGVVVTPIKKGEHTGDE